MSESNSEYDDYESLLRHPGWLRYTQDLTDFWDKHFADRTRDALNQTNDQDGLAKLRQAAVARDAVLTGLKHPEERLNVLRRQVKPELTLHRGGY